jgi:hypothetical protein
VKLPHRRQFLHLAAGAAALPAVSRAATWGRAALNTSAVEGSTVRKSCHGEMPAGKMACAFAKFMVLDLGEVMGSALITSCAGARIHLRVSLTAS